MSIIMPLALVNVAACRSYGMYLNVVCLSNMISLAIVNVATCRSYVVYLNAMCMSNMMSFALVNVAACRSCVVQQDETPAEQRARAALAKAQAREIEKQKESKVKLAELILGKTGPIIISLSALLSKDGMMDVASIIRDPLAESLELFSSFEASAKDIIASGGEGYLQITDMKDPCCNCKALSM
jgi:hypothetical protein